MTHLFPQDPYWTIDFRKEFSVSKVILDAGSVNRLSTVHVSVYETEPYVIVPYTPAEALFYCGSSAASVADQVVTVECVTLKKGRFLVLQKGMTDELHLRHVQIVSPRLENSGESGHVIGLGFKVDGQAYASNKVKKLLSISTAPYTFLKQRHPSQNSAKKAHYI